MMGTSFSVTAAMRLIPPSKIIPINMAAAAPVHFGGYAEGVFHSLRH